MHIKLIFALSLVLHVRVLRTRKWPVKEEVSHGSIGTRFPLQKVLRVLLATPSPCLDPPSGMRHRE